MMPAPKMSFMALFGSLTALLIVSPFVGAGPLIEAAFVAVVMAAIATTLEGARPTFWLAASLGTLAVGLRLWLLAAPNATLLAPLATANALGFSAIAIVAVVLAVGRAKRISSDTLYGAISAYLLIGLAFAFAFALLEMLSPGAFSAGSSPDRGLARFAYFSLITLTTLGYGDLVPLTPQARTLAAAEAMIGQIYLTVLVARLVGLHIGQQTVKARP